MLEPYTMSLPTLTTHLPNLTYDNISLLAIPWAWILSIAAPRLYGRYLYYRAKNQDMDVVQPRVWAKSIADDKGLDARTRGQIMRCEAAMNNGHENIGMFAAAVVAGNAAGLDQRLLNILSLGYIVSRVAFNVIYVWQDTFVKSALRPVAFLAGVAVYMTLFVKAGYEFQKAASNR